MRTVWYLLIGIFFGFLLFQSQAASWFRIYEMFQFKSFHMYGIIGTAVVLGVIIVQLIKRLKINTFYGEPITFRPKNKSVSRYLYGGILFGLGWALAGACPGPMFTLVGAGYVPMLLVIIFALLGTYIYGLIRHKLPH